MNHARYTIGAAVSRVRQFLAAVRARVSADEIAILEQHLDPSQRDLFRAMSPIDQRHCLDVFNALLQQGHSDPDLLRAALLHDIGKRGIRLWHRVAGVLLEAFWPTLLEKLAVNRPQNWLYGLYIYRHHAEFSAEMAQRSGCSPSVVELIRGHHTPSENEQAKDLREADRLS
jgi:putative nucleotidyltransferase with HDIG domain